MDYLTNMKIFAILTVIFKLQIGSMAEIVYPQGCRPITDDLGPDELVRRLKVCVIKESTNVFSLSFKIYKYWINFFVKKNFYQVNL